MYFGDILDGQSSGVEDLTVSFSVEVGLVKNDAKLGAAGDLGRALYESLVVVQGFDGRLDRTGGVLGDQKRMFIDFVKRMIKWRPEERSTAKELLQDPCGCMPMMIDGMMVVYIGWNCRIDRERCTRTWKQRK